MKKRLTGIAALLLLFLFPVLPAAIGAETIAWTTSPSVYRGQNGTRVTFTCPPNGTLTGIYGTDVYTDDSSICSAAVHVGIINLTSGGTVTVEILPGQEKYLGSIRNGVSANPYGSWYGSFSLVGSGAAPAPSTEPRGGGAAPAQGGLLETIEVPNTKPVKVMSSTVFEAGKEYIIEASGTFDDWGKTPHGIDAVWCFAEWRCGKDGESWNQLRINEKGMPDIEGKPIPYNPNHVYQIRFKGQGKPVEFYMSDAQGSWSDNLGATTVKIYAAGGAPSQGGLLETLEIPNTKPVKVMSKTVFEAGKEYIIEASGTFDDWGKTPHGIDAVWCFAEWRCGKSGESWNQLRINDKGMPDIEGKPIPYNPNHVYQVRFKGQGKPVEFYMSDAQDSAGDNLGATTVRIYGPGSAR